MPTNMTTAIPPTEYNKEKGCNIVQEGSKKENGPRLFPNTELCVDLKLLTRTQGRIAEGDYIPGTITRDGEEHFTFVEDATEKKQTIVKRNPIVYSGMRVNVHRKDDGTLYPTFNRPDYTEVFTFRDFCREAAEELLTVACLVKE